MSTTLSPDQRSAPLTTSQSRISRMFEQVGIMATLGNRRNASPLSIRRIGATALVTGVALAGATSLVFEQDADSVSSEAAIPALTTTYPDYSVDQLRALPTQRTVNANPGDGEQALIDKADPGLLTSSATGVNEVVGELTQIIDSQTPDGQTIIAGDGYSIPVVPPPAVNEK